MYRLFTYVGCSFDHLLNGPGWTKFEKKIFLFKSLRKFNSEQNQTVEKYSKAMFYRTFSEKSQILKIPKSECLTLKKNFNFTVFLRISCRFQKNYQILLNITSQNRLFQRLQTSALKLNSSSYNPFHHGNIGLWILFKKP